MLDDLVDVIQTLQQRIRDHDTTLREGAAREMRTRAVLIDPLLRVLGWDVSDPSLVTLEYVVGNGRADYAMLNEKSTAIAFIEAKHLGEPLERSQHEDQVFTYALRQQVKYAALTDGNRWILDDVSVFSGERRVLDLSIAHTSPYECALKLLLLWRPNLSSGQPVEASEPILGDGGNGAPGDDVAPPPPPWPRADWIPLTDVSARSGTKPHGSIILPNAEPQPITDWSDVLAEVGKWLYSHGYLHRDNCSLPNSNSERAQFIVHTQPFHRSGRGFTVPLELGPQVFLEKSWQTPNTVRNAVKLLNHCGINPDTVHLQVGE